MDKEKRVKKGLLLSLSILLTISACMTVPDGSRRIGGDAKTQKESSAVRPGQKTDNKTGAPAAPARVITSYKEAATGPEYRLASVSSYLSNGVLDTETTMEYESGFLVAERTSFADGSPAGLVSYQYQGDLISLSKKTDRFGNVVSARAFAYDGSGHLVREETLKTDGKPLFVYRYSYDPDGRRAGLEIVAGDGSLLGYAEYSYTNGRNDRVETFSSAGVMQDYLTREFDEAGRPILEVVSGTDGMELEKVIFAYRDGMLAEKETFVQTRKTGSIAYEYDDNGNLAVRIRYDRTGKPVERNEYSYEEVDL